MYVQASKHGRKKDLFFRTKIRISKEHEPLDDEYDEPLVECKLKSDADAKPLDDGYEQKVELKTNKEQKRTRRGGRKHKSKYKFKFSLLGNNSAGLKAKKDSLEAIIGIFNQPSCITLQETKLAKNTHFQLANYQIFQKNRNGSGGGLLTAVDPNLNPVQVATKNEEAEILTVQIQLNNKN